jgi:Uma2 family endonuclease
MLLMFARQPAWGDVYQVPTTMTADDLLRLPDDGSKNELYEGVLIKEEMTSLGHGNLCQRLGVELGIYAKASGFSNPILQNALFDLTPAGSTRKTVLAHDLAIARANATLPWDHIPHETPLLAVEVVSASQPLAELGIKAQFYRNVGADEVWLIDHGTRTVMVWNAQGTKTLSDGQALTSALLPGFSIDVTYLLDG